MTKFLRLVPAIVVAFALQQTAVSQSLSVNTDGSVANPSAILDVKSTLKGVLIPRMSKAEKNLIPSPATGLLIFQNTPDSIGFHYFDGSNWKWLQNSLADSINWRTGGNTGLTDLSSFIGNIDNVPINFRINNKPVGKFNLSRSNYSIGRGAGNDLVSQGHVSIGDSAGASINNSLAGVYIGFRSGVRNTGGNNTFVGASSGENTTTGSDNAFFGSSAGINNTTGYSNTFLGMNSGKLNTSGAENTAVGLQSLQNDSSGLANVAVGFQSLMNNTDGNNNTAMGYHSLLASKNGIENTAIGTNAMEFGGDAPSYNTAVGGYSMWNYGTSNWNTALGYYNLASHVSGDNNVAIGANTLVNDITGINNTAVGTGALIFNSDGTNNTGIGRFSLQTNSAGSNNTGLGYLSNVFSNNLTNATAIGARAMVGQSNSMVLGSISGVNGAAANTLVGIGTTTPATRLHVNGNFTLGTNGTALSNLIKVTVNKDIASVLGGTTNIETFAVLNAAVGSTVYISPDFALTDGLIIAYARVSAAGTVEVKFTNTTGSAINVGAMDYFITVIQ
ncbi:MAG: hypothetical protein ABIR78_00885 [Ferruginibacter sp.]